MDKSGRNQLNWIDIHSHILPGFDDGASNDNEFLEIAREAVRHDTSIMVATPHFDAESTSYEPGEPAEAVKKYNALLQAEKIPLTIVPGVEVRLNAGLYSLTENPDVLNKLTLGRAGKFMLVDLPLINIPMATQEIFFKIQLSGITPILAHPERNRYLVEHPATVRGFVEQGTEIQVDSGSLVGIFGKIAQRTARNLLKEGLAKLVASDTHDTSGRGPNLSNATKVLKDIIGKEAPEIILNSNPGRVLEGYRPLPLEITPLETGTNLKSSTTKKLWRRLH